MATLTRPCLAQPATPRSPANHAATHAVQRPPSPGNVAGQQLHIHGLPSRVAQSVEEGAAPKHPRKQKADHQENRLSLAELKRLSQQPGMLGCLNATLTVQIKLSLSWQEAFLVFIEFSDRFNPINTTALLHRIAQLEGNGFSGKVRGTVHEGVEGRKGSRVQGRHASGPLNVPASLPGPAPEQRMDLRSAVSELRDFAEGDLPNYRPREMATTLYALARLGHLTRRFAQLVAARTDPAHFNNQELANTWWALAAGQVLPPDASWVRGMLQEVGSRRSTLSHQELVNCLWAVARLQVAPGRPWVAAITHELCRRTHKLVPQDFANAAWALAKLGFKPQALAQQQAKPQAEAQGEGHDQHQGHPLCEPLTLARGEVPSSQVADMPDPPLARPAAGMLEEGPPSSSPSPLSPSLSSAFCQWLGACTAKARLMSNAQLSSLLWAVAVGGWDLPLGSLPALVQLLKERVGGPGPGPDRSIPLATASSSSSSSSCSTPVITSSSKSSELIPSSGLTHSTSSSARTGSNIVTSSGLRRSLMPSDGLRVSSGSTDSIPSTSISSRAPGSPILPILAEPPASGASRAGCAPGASPANSAHHPGCSPGRMGARACALSLYALGQLYDPVGTEECGTEKKRRKRPGAGTTQALIIRSGGGSSTLDPSLVDSLVSGVVRCCRPGGGAAASPHDVMCTLWTVARLGHDPSPQDVLHLLSSFQACIHEAHPAEVAGLLQGLARLRFRPDPNWVRAVNWHLLTRLDAYTPEDLAITLSSLAMLRLQLSGRTLQMVMQAFAGSLPPASGTAAELPLHVSPTTPCDSAVHGSSTAPDTGSTGGQGCLPQGFLPLHTLQPGTSAPALMRARAAGNRSSARSTRGESGAGVAPGGPSMPTRPMRHGHVAALLWALPRLVPPERRHLLGHACKQELQALERASLMLLPPAPPIPPRPAPGADRPVGPWVEGGPQQLPATSPEALSGTPGSEQQQQQPRVPSSVPGGHEWLAGGAPGSVPGSELLHVATTFAALHHLPSPEWLAANQWHLALAWPRLSRTQRSRLVGLYALLARGPRRHALQRLTTECGAAPCCLLPE